MAMLYSSFGWGPSECSFGWDYRIVAGCNDPANVCTEPQGHFGDHVDKHTGASTPQ